MNIQSIKKSIGIFSRAAVTSINWPPVKDMKVKCTIDELEVPLFECGPGHLTQGYGFFGYTGVPAPVVLSDDPWFGPAPIVSEKQIKYQQESEVFKTETLKHYDMSKESENIHEVMYDMSTKHGKTTTQMDPVGGSENFQGGSENVHR